MKRFLTYTLAAVILLIGSARITVSGNEIAFQKRGLTEQQLPSSGQHQSVFRSDDLLFSAGIGNEQIRLNQSLQNLSVRVLTSSVNIFRALHFTHLGNQKFFTTFTVFLLKSAFKQSDGYYLYHLRKLLI